MEGGGANPRQEYMDQKLEQMRAKMIMELEVELAQAKKHLESLEDVEAGLLAERQDTLAKMNALRALAADKEKRARESEGQRDEAFERLAQVEKRCLELKLRAENAEEQLRGEKERLTNMEARMKGVEMVAEGHAREAQKLARGGQEQHVRFIKMKLKAENAEIQLQVAKNTSMLMEGRIKEVEMVAAGKVREAQRLAQESQEKLDIAAAKMKRAEETAEEESQRARKASQQRKEAEKKTTAFLQWLEQAPSFFRRMWAEWAQEQQPLQDVRPPLPLPDFEEEAAKADGSSFPVEWAQEQQPLQDVRPALLLPDFEEEAAKADGSSFPVGVSEKALRKPVRSPRTVTQKREYGRKLPEIPEEQTSKDDGAAQLKHATKRSKRSKAQTTEAAGNPTPKLEVVNNLGSSPDNLSTGGGGGGPKDESTAEEEAKEDSVKFVGVLKRKRRKPKKIATVQTPKRNASGTGPSLTSAAVLPGDGPHPAVDSVQVAPVGDVKRPSPGKEDPNMPPGTFIRKHRLISQCNNSTDASSPSSKSVLSWSIPVWLMQGRTCEHATFCMTYNKRDRQTNYWIKFEGPGGVTMEESVPQWAIRYNCKAWRRNLYVDKNRQIALARVMKDELEKKGLRHVAELCF